MEESEKITREVKPDLIMDIRVTEAQMHEFGIEIYKSKLIRLGREAIVEGDIGTAEIPNEEIDFYNAKYISLKYYGPNTPEAERPSNGSGDFGWGDYLELVVRNMNDTEITYYLSGVSEVPIYRK